MNEIERLLPAVLAGERPPDNASGLCAAAVAAFRQGRQAVARQLLLQASSLEPERPEPYALLGDLLVATRRRRRAEQYYQAACRQRPEEEGWLVRLATYYHAADRPYAALAAARKALRLNPQQEALAALLAELESLYPQPPVTVMVRAWNVASALPHVVSALQAQSYPVAEIVVVDDGSTDQTAAVAETLPVRLLRLPAPLGWSACRRAAAELAGTDLLAFVEGDILPDDDWLEELVLFLLRETFAEVEPSPTRPFLAAVNGDVVDRQSVSLPDFWRARHLPAAFGAGHAMKIPWLYCGAGLIYRQAALLPDSAPGESKDQDYPFWGDLVARGYRLGFSDTALAWRLRRDDLASLFDRRGGYRTPYIIDDHVDDCCARDLRELASWIPTAAREHQAEVGVDRLFRVPELAYLTFLSLPWRLLALFRRVAREVPAADRPAVQQTHAASYLVMMSLLAKTGGEELIRRAVEDLTPCRPEQPELAELCGEHGVAAMLACDRGEAGPDPLRALPAADLAVANVVLETAGLAWLGKAPSDWAEIAASAAIYQSELAVDACADSRPRLALLRPPLSLPPGATPPEPCRWEIDPMPLRAAGCTVIVVDAQYEAARETEILGRLTGFEPTAVLVGGGDSELRLEWCLRLKEALPEDCRIFELGGSGGPQVDAVLTSLATDELAPLLGCAVS